MSMNVTTTQQTPQTSVLGSMGKAGAIGAGIAAGATGATMSLSSIAMKCRPAFKDSFIKDMINQAKKYPKLPKNIAIRNYMAEILKNARKGKIALSTILKSAAACAIPVAIISAGVAGIVGLIKASGNKS